jgi:hypothetical protein
MDRKKPCRTLVHGVNEVPAGDYREMSSIFADQYSSLKYEPKCGGGGGGVPGSQPMSTAVHRSPNNPWISNSIFNLCFYAMSVIRLDRVDRCTLDLVYVLSTAVTSARLLEWAGGLLSPPAAAWCRHVLPLPAASRQLRWPAAAWAGSCPGRWQHATPWSSGTWWGYAAAGGPVGRFLVRLRNTTERLKSARVRFLHILLSILYFLRGCAFRY